MTSFIKIFDQWLKQSNSVPTIWLLFIFLVSIVIFSALVIPKLALVFFENIKVFNKTIFNRAVINILFLSLITSLPEIISIISFPFSSAETLSFGNQISPSGVFKSFSNVLGSNLFSGLFFAFFSFFFTKFLFFRKIEIKLKLVTLFVLILNFLFLLSFLFPQLQKVFLIYGKVSFFNIFFIICYLIFIIYLFKQYRVSNEQKEENQYFLLKRSNSFIFIYLFIFIIVLVSSLLILMRVCENLKTRYQWNDQSIGGILFAFVTTSPEVWSAFALLKIGLSASAFGIVIGSHLFNLIFFLAVDLFYQGEMLKYVFSEKGVNIFLIPFLFLFLITLLFIFWQQKYLKKQKMYYFFPPTLIITISFLTFKSLL